jgi:hypothetical protein
MHAVNMYVHSFVVTIITIGAPSLPYLNCDILVTSLCSIPIFILTLYDAWNLLNIINNLPVTVIYYHS